MVAWWLLASGLFPVHSIVLRRNKVQINIKQVHSCDLCISIVAAPSGSKRDDKTQKDGASVARSKVKRGDIPAHLHLLLPH